MNLAFLLLAFCAGVAISTQSAVNSQLAAGIGGNTVAAALISFLVGSLVLAAFALVRGGLGGSLALVPDQPKWMLAGGLLGAGFIFCTTLLAPRIGVTNMLVLIIAGQLLASVTIDHFGLLNMTVRSASFIKVIGAVVVMAGVALTLFGDRLLAALRTS